MTRYLFSPLLFLLLAALLPLSLWSADEASSDDTLTTESTLPQETRLLQRLLEMDSTELSKLRQTIERIERMSPEERARMSQRIDELRQSRGEKRHVMGQFYQSLSPEARQVMRQRWLEMPPAERKVWREKLRESKPEERVRIFETEGFLPGRDPSKKKQDESPERTPPAS